MPVPRAKIVATLAFTLSDCETVSAGALDKVPTEHRVCMLAALGFLRALDRAISGARRLIVICLQDAARSMGMSDSEFCAWLAPRFPRHPDRRCAVAPHPD